MVAAAVAAADGSGGSSGCLSLEPTPTPWTYLNSVDAAQLDVDLMSPEGGFVIEQLMELAGLSVAAAAAELFPATRAAEEGGANEASKRRRVLIVCGPGNNGGDGLVAARHLHHFGYRVVVAYPRQSATSALFKGLVAQLRGLGVPVVRTIAEANEELGPGAAFDCAVDAIFGFSFKGEPRAPFNDILAYLKTSGLPLLSVDVPSGWSVDGGDLSQGQGLRPDALVSLTTPKLCAKGFEGRHFLGGRFVPPSVVAKYGLVLPPYPGAQQVVEITATRDASPVASPAGKDEKAGLPTRDLPTSDLPVYEGRRAGSIDGDANADDDVAVVWVTAPSAEAAKSLAGSLVAQRVAACVSIVPSVESLYEWQGKVETETEALLMIKTRVALLASLTKAVAKEHPYEVPETIAAAVIGGNRQYLAWVRENTSK